MRNLKAIEIAEGALLADVAVIFQLIAAFLPVGSSFFYLLVFIVFAILVLRRAMYVSMMGLCVALFMVSVVIGPQHSVLMLLEGAGGIFLGVTMKYRLHHIPLILLGMVSGAVAFYCLLILVAILSGIPLSIYALSVRHTYNSSIPLIAMIAAKIGLGDYWKQSIYPHVVAFSGFLFAYWWVTLFVLDLILMCPVVSCIYIVTNLCVRRLGYEVRPLPGVRLGRLLRRRGRRLFKLMQSLTM